MTLGIAEAKGGGISAAQGVEAAASLALEEREGPHRGPLLSEVEIHFAGLPFHPQTVWTGRNYGILLGLFLKKIFAALSPDSIDWGKDGKGTQMLKL